MARTIQSLYSLNRGVVSRYGLARADVKRLAMGAQVMTNWMPKVLGQMNLRVGREYLGSTLNDAATRFLRFIFSTTDTSLVELTSGQMRVWINDALLTRPAVTAAVANGTFATNLTSWTNMDQGGATSSWAAPSYMQLVGNGSARAIREQAVTPGPAGTEHALRIIIARGPVSIRVGSSSGDDDYVGETVLYTGTHSLSFVPTGTFYIRFFSSQVPKVWVDSCTIESAGVMVVPTTWAAADLGNIRIDQSADVLFVACAGQQQRRIERRGTRPAARSWSVAVYQSPDGPFQVQNVGPTTIAASAITGNITLTASQPLFKASLIGSLFSLTSVGQTTTVSASATNQFSDSIRVTGLSAQRGIVFTISGTFNATVVGQQSFDNATWADVGSPLSWTAPATTPYNDTLDNQIVFYRIGIEGTYVSGTAVCSVSIGQGSIRGIVRVTDFTDETHVGAEVLTDLGGTSASTIWEQAQWSSLIGWPTAVKIHEGRLWWTGQNGIWGSISDAYDSFDETFFGDAGPINRTVGSGPVDVVNWLLSLKGLLLGGQGEEYTARSSSLDEPLTPTSFNLKVSGTQGSGSVDAIKVDQDGYFVNRSGVKVFDLAFDLRTYDYISTDLMELVPELGVPGIVRMDVQRLPDTRLHCVRSDGTAIVCVMNKAEEVAAWTVVTSSVGFIEDVVILPALTGNLDDQVYYVVRYVINGSTVRYLEKWAQEVDCRGDKQLCFLADSYVSYSGAPVSIVLVPHLELQTVVVWADGFDVGTDDTQLPWTQTYTVSGGQITLAVPASNVVVGLGCVAQFQSAKLGLMEQGGSPLNQQKRATHIGLILADSHPQGLRYGAQFDSSIYTMDDMPLIEDGTLVGTGVVTAYDQNLVEFPGTWTTDMRVCLQAQFPRPCTVMAVTVDGQQNS